MAKAYTNVNSTTGTFAGWLSKANELYYDMSTMIVTVADVAAPNSSNESRTTGNADIQGIFSANNIVVWDTLAGGRNEEWANTDTLYIVSNTQIGNSSQTDTLTVYGDATFDANVQIGSAATDGLTIAANTVVNGLSFFTANSRFNDNVLISFGTDSDTSLYHDGSDLKLIHNNANTSDFIIEDVSGNDVFTFTTDHSTFTVARYDDATDGPSIVLLDEGTTPDAANVGGIFFKGQDSGSAITEYAAIKGIAEDNTNTTEDGALLLYTTIGGTAKAMIAVNEASDTAVSLRFDGSEKLATKTDGVLVSGELESTTLDVNGVANISGVVTLGANANFGDDGQANFGAAADLQIFHDASHSHIKDNGTGNLKISSSQIDFLGLNPGVETMATMVVDGAVTLYHNTAVKIATTATGVVVTGDTDTDTLTVGGGYGSTGLAIAATGNIQTNGTLTVDGLASLNGGIAVDANFTVNGTSGATVIGSTLTASGIIKTDDATEATNTTDGSLQTDGGLSVVKDIIAGNDIKLLSDAAGLHFGGDGDVNLTHVHDTGLLLNSSRVIQFRDSAINIGSPADGDLDINADDEIELNSTLIDVNGNLDVSGTIVGASTLSATTGTFSGILKTDDATEATNTTDGSLQTDGGLSVVKDAVFGDDVLLLSDAAVIKFGVNSDVTLTHVADAGLTLSVPATADNSFPTLTLAAGDNDIAANDVLGALNFVAPAEGAGTDAVAVAGSLRVISEGDFAADNNASKMSFMLGASEAATEKMSLSSAGVLATASLDISGDIDVDGTANLDAVDIDGAVNIAADVTIASTNKIIFNDASQFIQGASGTILDINATDEIELNATLLDVNANINASGTYTGAGTMTTGGNIVIPDAGTIGSVSDADAISIGSDEIELNSTLIDVNGNLDVSGTIVGVAATFSGLTSADGGIDVNSAKFTVAAATGDTVIAAATVSNSSTTGALKVAGGTGIAGKLYVGDDVNVAGDLVVDGTATFAGGGQLTVNNSIVTTLSVTGDTDIGSGASDTVTINASVDSNIVPSTDSARDLGTTSFRWRNAYIDDLTLTANVNLQTRGSALFYDADNSNFVAFKSPATVSSNITWTLPDADATTSGFALVSNASGVLSWAAAGATTTSDTSTNANELIYFGDTTSGAVTAIHHDAGLTYNPSTGTLTSAAFAGVASSATTADTAVTLTGLTSTVTELNKVDGGTAASSITAAGADRVVYNDAGVMKQVALTTLDTYFSSTTKTLTNKTLTSPTLNTPSIGTSFTFDSITVAGIQTSAESFADNDTSLMTSAAINDRIAVVAEATIGVGNSVVLLDSAATKTAGDLTFNDNVAVNFGTGADVEIYHTGSHLYADINTGSFYIRDGSDGNATALLFTPTSGDLTLLNNDAAASGPTIVLRHDTPTPAASDEAGQIFFQSDNAAGTPHNYAYIDSRILDPTTDSEDGQLSIYTLAAGSLSHTIKAASGVATLYHLGSAKLATASGGVTITGTATATTFSGSFSGSGASLTAIPATSLTGDIASARLTSVPAASLTGNIASARLTSVPAASLTGTINDDRLPASISSSITGTASKVTVTDSTTNLNYPVVFHDGVNGLLDDTGALRYNPSTGTLLVPNLTVAGTTTQVDTVTMNAANAIVFEGATPDNFETTLTITDPTADRTITLPNATGTVALTSSDITGNAATATTLATARTIGGTSFDGSANIAVALAATATTLATARTIGGTSFNGSADIAVALAATATTLATARTIGGTSFDGSANIDLPGVNIAGDQNTSGTAAVATVATTVTITDNESTNENNAIVFTAGGDVDGGNLGLESDGTLTYNPSTGKITATGFVGALTGNADTVTNGVYTSRTLTAGTGLTGGGTLAANRTFAIDSTVATLTGSQTLTNKTLTSPSIGTGFTFDSVTLTTVQTSAESFADNDTSLMTSAAIDDRINAASVGAAANDISAGDAAVNITTSSGNITIDAAASDSDIILKGTDGGADITMLTLDGSAAGEATFNAAVIATSFVTTSSGTSNFIAGLGSGASIASGGNDNVIIGSNAADAATTADNTIAIGHDAIGAGVLTGTDNTAIGNKAGDDLTSGAYNVMVGHEAGTNATTATKNVAIGLNAMHGQPSVGAVTGISNVAIGENAGYTLTTGASNVFVGFGAGEKATSANNTIAIGRYALGLGELAGADNTAIGQYAGYDLTDGTHNNFIGYGAGFNATTASNAIAIGTLAMGVGELTGDNNIGIGRQAGNDLTNGAYNVMVGYQAGTNVTTGADNTILGPNAGDALTTGSNNTIIGHDAAASAVDVSNEITLGDTNVTKFRVPGAGFQVTSGALIATGDITAFGSLSDIRLKENIEPITNALDKVSQIGGYTFAYKKNPDVRMTGVIAQEVEKVLPEVIYTTADINSGEENLAVRYENMIGLLVEAIKELKTEVEELKKGK